MPIYFIFIVVMLALLIGGCAWYVEYYKRKINESLADTQKKRKAMPAPFNVAIMLLIAFLIFAIFISFAIGFGIGYRSLDDEPENQYEGQIESFYAKVVNVDEYSITVKGIDLNEKDFRGEFTYDLPEEIIIEWRDEIILLSDLEKDDMVSIILMKDMSGVEYIYKIQLLKDE